MINRRGLITGLIAFAAAPAIVRAESLMKVKAVDSISMRIITEYNPQVVTKIDILYGTLTLSPTTLNLGDTVTFDNKEFKITHIANGIANCQ